MTDKPSFDQKNQSVETQTNINHADQVIVQPSRSAPALPLPQQIPSPPLDFTGREEEIKCLLDQFDQGVTITGLRGLGGIGKTALALVLADRLKDRFPGGQIFLDMQGTSKISLKPEDAMAHVIHSYCELDARLPTDLNGLKGLYHSILSGKRALILLDNAANREQVELLLPPVGSALLITSRNKFALAGLKEKDLNVLPLKDAKKLLLEIAERIGDHAEEMAKLCGCLPLALRTAAFALKERPNQRVVNYTKMLGDSRKRLELVEASFDLSYRLLPDELKRLWCLLSVFPADFDLGGAGAVWEMEQIPAEDALCELVKWSLVDFLPATAESGRYRLHDLARVFANTFLEPDTCEIAQQRHARHYQELLRNSRDLYLQGGESLSKGLALFDADWINMREGQKWTATNTAKSDEIANICSNFAGAGSILGLRLRPLENIEWLKSALIAARQIGNHEAEGVHLGNLGNAYNALGDTKKAMDCFKLRLTSVQEIGDKQGESNALGNLGCAYSAIGNFPEALQYHQHALDIDRAIGYSRGECAALGNIGIIHLDLGDPRKAIECFKDALTIARSIGGRREEGNFLGNLGIAYKNLGETRTAIEYYELQLAIASELKDRLGEGNALGNLGIAYKSLGDIGKAIEYSEKQLVVARYIGDRRGEGNALGNLGNAYSSRGDFFRAIEYHERALAIDREIDNKLGEGNDLGNLGFVHFQLDKPQNAIEYYEQALKISREIGNKPGEGRHLFNMALSLANIGQRGEAIKVAKHARDIFEQIESPHAETVRKKLAEWGS